MVKSHLHIVFKIYLYGNTERLKSQTFGSDKTFVSNFPRIRLAFPDHIDPHPVSFALMKLCHPHAFKESSHNILGAW